MKKKTGGKAIVFDTTNQMSEEQLDACLKELNRRTDKEIMQEWKEKLSPEVFESFFGNYIKKTTEEETK